ncbi:hypothetical protein ACSQ67_023219 [Phaseolus vulgaris]
MFLKCFGESSSSGRQYPTVIEELCTHFSLDDLRKSTNNFDPKRVIGRFGNVYKGCLQHNDGSDYAVAVKIFYEYNSKWFEKDVELLCQLHHPNCVSIVGFCRHEKQSIIVYEYMSNGSLDQHLRGAHFKEKPKPIKSDLAAGEPLEKKSVEENIDPKIKGKIAPECWQVFIDIILRCLQNEPDERPTMGEVEVELEHALLLQDQADVTNINSDYTLLSETFIIPKSDWRFEYVIDQ